MVAVSSVGVAPTWTVGASASIFFLCSTKTRRFFMMAYNNDIGLDPVGDPTCLRKQKVGKPSRNAAQPYAKAEGCGKLSMRTLPGPMDCGKAGPFGLVPGMLTHLQGDQVNTVV